MASNSRPIVSICSTLRRASGLSGSLRSATGGGGLSVADMVGLSVGSSWFELVRGEGRPASAAGSEVDLDRALGGVDARAHDLAGGPRHAARAQVAHLAGAQAPDAAVADAHAAAEGHGSARALACEEDRLGSVA